MGHGRAAELFLPHLSAPLQTDAKGAFSVGKEKAFEHIFQLTSIEGFPWGL